MRPNLFKASKPKIKAGKAILALLLVAALTSCSNRQPAAPKADQTSDTQNLSDLVAELTPDRWNVFEGVKIFSAENLYEQINGRAELYLAYDVISLTIATFEKKSDIGEFIELSIFDMGNPTNAFGIFSVERSQGEKALDLGRASYRSDSNAYIWKGKYYIAIVASDTTEELRLLGLDLAHRVISFLTDSGDPVWGLSALPQENRVPDSVQYFKVDAMGLDFMQNTYTAKYCKDDAEITAFLSQQSSFDSALDSLERYAKHAAKYGRGSERMTKNGIEFVLCDMHDSFDVIFQKGRLVGGVLSVMDQDEALEAAADLWVLILAE